MAWIFGLPARLRRRRFASSNSAIPAPIAIPPYTAHRVWPVMKLPGKLPIPCSNQIIPKKARIAPAMFKAVLKPGNGPASKVF
jgi:hypothetical protein